MSIVSGSALCNLIPHSGSMCLLDDVTEYDEENIVCTTRTHRNKNNPLRNNNRLDAINLIEYGAQAMAVHGGLMATQQQQIISAGYLAAVRNVKLAVEYIDDIETTLIVKAKRLMAGNGSMVYEFEISANDAVIASGRLTVVAIKDNHTGAAS